MKKLVLFIAAVAFGTIGAHAAKLDDNVAMTTRYGNSFIFVEDGVTFSVYPDGEFDFYMDNRVNVGVGAQIGNVGITFNSGYNYNPYVQYDDYGAVVQVENTPIFYDYYGRVSQIGNVNIWYNNGRVRRIGGLHVYYNGGVFSHYTGYINIYNRHYVYRPFHRYFLRPSVGFCNVYARPYRRYYNPVRYTYYAPYRYNQRRAYARIGKVYRNDNRHRRDKIYRNDNRVSVRDNNSIRRSGDYGRSNRALAQNNDRKGSPNVYRSNSTVKRQATPQRSVRQGDTYRKSNDVSRSNRSVTQKKVTRTPDRKTVTKRQVASTPNRKTVSRTTTTYRRPQTKSTSSRPVVRKSSAPKRATVNRSSAKRTVKQSTRTSSSRGNNSARYSRSSRKN